jgi:hypothetical protein
LSHESLELALQLLLTVAERVETLKDLGQDGGIGHDVNVWMSAGRSRG